ncbi:glutathione S-transferase [Diplogelasinospora grovesii]|uniref:Glutathione S-transferase n=1 Tax=Diplogelasinospora grovesii TaxID=303347 RepID=A0AAN6S5V3_9PEZI|nr:glutathione S-transferase [Diplogelasinospora grovesii]
MAEEPTGLKAKSGIELLTMGTPNGFKVSVLLEELKDAYGQEYTWQSININKNTQKQPWYTALNPNGRIPTIVDHNRDGFPVMEGLAILSYLTRHYDPEHRFSFPLDSDDYSVAEQWMAWQHGGLGPMQGQANHFLRFAKEKIPYPTQRYVGESERLYGILDARLQDRDFVAGPGRGKYSIADMSLIGWVNIANFSGIDLKQFPNVQAWLERIWSRPATPRAFSIPTQSALSNSARAKKFAEGDQEAIKKEEEAATFLKESKEKYGYKYSSP